MGELWDRRGVKNQCNTTMKEPGMWGAWLNDDRLGVVHSGGGGTEHPFLFHYSSPLQHIFFLSEIFLKQIGICFWQVRPGPSRSQMLGKAVVLTKHIGGG